MQLGLEKTCVGETNPVIYCHIIMTLENQTIRLQGTTSNISHQTGKSENHRLKSTKRKGICLQSKLRKQTNKRKKCKVQTPLQVTGISSLKDVKFAVKNALLGKASILGASATLVKAARKNPPKFSP